MGVKAIKIIAFLDIIISAGFIAQQISYTADQYSDYQYPRPNITEEIPPKQEDERSKPECTPYVFPIGQIVIRSKGATSRTRPPPKDYISKESLWLILILVVSTSFFSIVSSMAVIHTAKRRYHPSNEKFTFWMKCYAVSLLATIIAACVCHSSPSVVLSCIIFIGLRACIAVGLSEEFVCKALKATTTKGYKNDACKKMEAKLKKKAAKKEKLIEKEHNPATFLVMEYSSIKEQTNNLMV